MLKPEISLPVALATTGTVYGIYQLALPSLADARSVEAGNNDLRSAENQALWVSVAVCGAVSLIAGDPTPFVLGGLTAVALSWLHRHARAIDPASGKPAGLAPATFAPVEMRSTYEAAPA